MVDRAIWLFGAIHAAAYAIGCAIFVLTWIVWKVLGLLRLNGVILQWHVMRVRVRLSERRRG